MKDNFNNDAIRLKKKYVKYRMSIKDEFINDSLIKFGFNSVNDLLNSDRNTLDFCIVDICRKIPICFGVVNSIVYTSVLSELLERANRDYSLFVACAVPASISDKSYFNPVYANYLYIEEYHFFDEDVKDKITIVKHVEVEV